MNILVITPVDPRHAAHNRLHDLIGQLQRNHTVELVSTYGWWLSKDGKDVYDSNYYTGEIEEILSDIKLHYLTRKHLNPIIQELMPAIHGSRFRNVLNRKKYDLLLNYNSLLSGLLFSAIFRKTPMILDIADDLATMAGDSPMVPAKLRTVVRVGARGLLRLSIERSTAVTISAKSLKNLYGIPSGKSVFLPNGVNSEFFRRTSAERAKDEFGLRGKTVVGYAGVLREWVDLGMVFEALARLKSGGIEPLLFIVGGEGSIDDVKRQAIDHDVERQVVTVGTLPYSRMPEALSAMDIGLIPFKINSVTRNALPLKLFEYMACRVPVISQRLGPVIDAVGDRVLYASNPTELSRSIDYLISEPEVRSAMAEEGRRTIEEDWNWRAIGFRLEKIISVAQRRDA